MKIIYVTAGAAALLALCGGCKPHKTEPQKAIPAVQVSKKMAEADLAIVTLTAESEKRLGIETATAAQRKVDLTRSYGGELILPLARPGTNNEKSIYSLLPSMTPADLVRTAQMQADADGAIAAAKVQLEAAQLAFKRSEELMTSKAGVGRTVDEARTQVGLAEAALRTAEQRRALLGAPLFDAVKNQRLWVRVPVYVGELTQIKTDAAATISAIGGAGANATNTNPNAPALTANRVNVAFSTAASPAISELYYELNNSEATGLRLGTKVSVSLPVQGSEESLVVPASAILYDVHGNTWVYEKTGEHAFTRRRVELRRMVGSDAILGRGPRTGATIVTVGAAELFGTEFGAGK